MKHVTQKRKCIRHVLLYLLLPRNIFVAQTQSLEIFQYYIWSSEIATTVFYFLWTTCLAAQMLEESYIPRFGVSIVRKEWALNDKGNPSWVFLVFALTSLRLRSFPKPSLSWWNHKTMWGWSLSSLISVLTVFGTSLMWMVWGPSYLTPSHESTVRSGHRVDTSCFC